MALPAAPRAVFDRSLKLARAPLDMALRVTGGRESPAKFALDRVEAGARSATGAFFRDDDLKQEGRRALLAARERERALGLREESERVEREEERQLSESAERVRRANAKRDKSAQLEKLEVREKSLDAREAAARAKREAEGVRKAASKAKRARKKDG
jgi:hypothetical protein